MPDNRKRHAVRRTTHQSEWKGYLILGGLVLSLAVLLFSAGMLIKTLRAYHASREMYRTVAEQYAPSASYAPFEEASARLTTDPDTESDGLAPESGTETVTLPFHVDWDALMRENPDTVGWLYIEDTPVHYPVVQCSDNDYYLTHDFYKKESAGGALFLDTRSALLSEDSHLMIYGHRMKDDSMFGSVADYAAEHYYENHPVMYLLTPEQCWRAEIIGCRTVHTEEKYFPTLFESEPVYAAYLNRIRAQRYYETSAEPGTQFRLLTLVTCSTYTHGGDVRLLVHARLVPVRVAS